MIQKDLAMLAQHIYPGELSSANGTLIHSLLLVHLKYVEVICQEFTLDPSLTSPSSTLLFKRSFSSSWCHSRWVASAYLKANLHCWDHKNKNIGVVGLESFFSYFLLQRWQSNLCSPCSSRT